MALIAPCERGGAAMCDYAIDALSLYVTTHDEPYDWLTAFFAEFPNAHGNHLTVSPTATDCEYDDYGNPIEDSNADAKVSLIPISGSHRIWYRGQPIWFSFNRDTGKCPTEYLVCDFKIAQYLIHSRIASQ